MARSDNEVTIEFLQAFADTWNRHDADALIEFMTHDCVYETSSGPEEFLSKESPTDQLNIGGET